jgi:hypothetical protein
VDFYICDFLRTLKVKSLIAILAIVSLAFTPAYGAVSTQCLAGKRTALVEGHFTGPLVCSPKNATFSLVGRTAGDRFTIYDYRYRYLPSGGQLMHGGQKLVVFQRGKYIGQYPLSPPPYLKLSVKGARVVVTSGERGGRMSLDFSKEPPREVLINGEMEIFSR